MDAKERTSYYISFKPRTEQEVRKYLKQKGYDVEDTNDAILEAIEYRLIDDEDYCKTYYEYGLSKRWGKIRIKNELIKKGVSIDIIEDFFYNLEDEPDEYKMASEILEDILKNIDNVNFTYEEKKKLQAKISRRLASRGYSTDTIYQIIKKI